MDVSTLMYREKSQMKSIHKLDRMTKIRLKLRNVKENDKLIIKVVLIN